MENQVFEVAATFYKSMVLRDSEIWFSQNNVSNLEKFEKAVQKTGMMKSAFAIPLSSLTEVSYNEASESVKIKYINEKGKEKKQNIGFGNEELSNQFGEYLGNKLNFQKSEKQEGQIKPLLLNVLFILLSIAGTYFLGTMEDTAELTDSGSRRSRNNGALLKLVVDTIGQTGVLIIGTLITLYLGFKLFKRFKNPASEISYKK